MISQFYVSLGFCSIINPFPVSKWTIHRSVIPPPFNDASHAAVKALVSPLDGSKDDGSFGGTILENLWIS